MADRIKLTITSVKEPRKVGQGEVLQFLATGPDNKTLNYGVWDKAVWPYIKKSTVVDCEIETKVSEKKDQVTGENYVSRNIVQLYIDGKPIFVKKTGAGRSWGKSSEDLKAERASNEAQVACRCICDLEIAGRAVQLDLITLRNQWLKKALS